MNHLDSLSAKHKKPTIQNIFGEPYRQKVTLVGPDTHWINPHYVSWINSECTIYCGHCGFEYITFKDSHKCKKRYNIEFDIDDKEVK